MVENSRNFTQKWSQRSVCSWKWFSSTEEGYKLMKVARYVWKDVRKMIKGIKKGENERK